VWTVLHLCKFYPGICLTTEEKAWKNLRVRKISVRVRKTSVRVQYTDYQNTHTHTHTTKQYKTTTVQIKTNSTRYTQMKLSQCNQMPAV